MRKKRRLIFTKKCNKCGKEPAKEKVGGWEVTRLCCACGGRIITDFTEPRYE